MAFSFHLWWEVSRRVELSEVEAVCEVLRPPAVPRLYFWALQASFLEGGVSRGAAHLGLQWNPRYPESRAANWGGYAAPAEGGGVLSGSDSPLSSTPGDPNTRDYLWRPGTPYRLRIHPSPLRGWRGEITELETGLAVAVRDLYVGGERLGFPVVWSEVFAGCHEPSVVVRWSDCRTRTATGAWMVPLALRANYQLCPNTTAEVDEKGVLQATNTERLVPQGAEIRL